MANILNRSIELSRLIVIKNRTPIKDVLECFELLGNVRNYSADMTTQNMKLRNLILFLIANDLNYSVTWLHEQHSSLSFFEVSKTIDWNKDIVINLIFNETIETMIILNFGPNAYIINNYITDSATDVGKITF